MKDFAGGDISSKSGVVFLELAEKGPGLLKSVARKLPGKALHGIEKLLRQRVLAMVLNYEDVNNHDGQRDDVALQTACGSNVRLASASTVGHLERRADREWAWAAHKGLLDVFVAGFRKPPKVLVLDVDTIDDRMHGKQEGKFFHSYYGGYCFLPLYVFCGNHLLMVYLRPADCDGTLHAAAVLRLLTRRLREA